MNLINLLLAALCLTLATATPVPQTDDNTAYNNCLGNCNGDANACLTGTKANDTSIIGVTFICQAEAFMCQTLCSGTLSFETVVQDWVPAMKAMILAWQAAK